MSMIENIAYAMIDQLADCCQGETDLYWVPAREEVHAVPAEGTPVEHGVFLTRLAACEDRDPVEAYLLTVCQGSVEMLADELGRDADELYDMAEKDLQCDEIFPENVAKAIADYHPKLAMRIHEMYRAWLIENKLYDFKQEAAELVEVLETKASQARAEDKVLFEAKRFSLDGGRTWVSEDELGKWDDEIKRRWAEIISAMDRRTCSYAAEQRYWEYQNDPVEFLRIYLEIAPEDLIVGGA